MPYEDKEKRGATNTVDLVVSERNRKITATFTHNLYYVKLHPAK
jgi:hypothetical protein